MILNHDFKSDDFKSHTTLYVMKLNIRFMQALLSLVVVVVVVVVIVVMLVVVL